MNKGNYLGEFEELILLAVASLENNAYGVSVMKYISMTGWAQVHAKLYETAVLYCKEILALSLK